MGDPHKVHLVNWAKICEPLQCGGLGVKNLRRFNQALLGKWLWKYGTEQEALWRRVVEVKYGSLWGGYCSRIVRGPYGVSLWKYIRKGWDTFLPLLSYNVGDGSLVRFWHDLWCGEAALKVAYPELFAISSDKDESVAALMLFRNGSLHWELNFVRNV